MAMKTAAEVQAYLSAIDATKRERTVPAPQMLVALAEFIRVAESELAPLASKRQILRALTASFAIAGLEVEPLDHLLTTVQ